MVEDVERTAANISDVEPSFSTINGWNIMEPWNPAYLKATLLGLITANPVRSEAKAKPTVHTWPVAKKTDPVGLPGK